MPLSQYRSKRNFKRTPEPNGGEPRGPGKSRPLVFVVQKHRASHLHYDFRLEMEGVLKSWAVPKGPSLNPADRRLAMMVEDHPFDYRTFEGTIPEGNYGAGTVIVWDQGTYHATGVTDRSESERTLLSGLRKGHLDFVLYGQKLQGEFSLVKMKGREENSWLLIKKKDQYASTKDVTEEEQSVESGRSLDEVEAAAGAQQVEPAKVKAVLGRKGALPRGVKPMLAVLADEPFDRAGWIFEIKWDGFRAIAELEKSRLHLYSRKNQDLAPLFPPVAEELRKLDFDAVLDGEIVVTDDEGRSRFELLQNYRRTGQGTPILYVFDLLYYGGRRLLDVPLVDRRNLLARILPPSPHIRISEFVTEGIPLYEAAKEKRLEGIIAKDGRSAYQPGVRSPNWLKIKTLHQQDAVIGGFTKPRGSRKALGALVLGVYQGEDLVYIGHTGGGLTMAELAELRERLDPLIVDTSPFKTKPKTNTPATWVRPELVCEVRYSNWTREGYMRQPIYLGLREDKNPREVTRDMPIETAPPLPPLKLLADPRPHKRSGAREKKNAGAGLKLLPTPADGASRVPATGRADGRHSAKGKKLFPSIPFGYRCSDCGRSRR
ncbi:MAG: non-homologous end-joining DNA ligase [Rudaea sp.]